MIDPVFRLSLSLIFVIGGVGHFLAHEYMLDRMALSPWKDHVVLIGDASILLWLSGLVFIGAGTSLALGWMTRLSCTALFLTLVPITFAIHIAPGHTGPLLKNIAILGALAFVFVRGPGSHSMDTALGRAAS
ncbi:MAG TPA: DoxX family protein [Erythrobacter sp.]|nr:DoxX family protein [Erythrobacter sp.]MAG05074.1 DoxX family protein [Sphingomonadaceae bacterium]MBN90993.1 DoxX family protein [Erythrobacteraceae bacterium]MCD1589597.1 DoxX family protein [Qipengyuania citrea]PNQ77456.1 DoxX family protein [Erythrobacter sp. SAORIC-644]